MKKLLFAFLLLFACNQLMAQNGVNIFEDPRIQFYMNKHEGAYQAQAPSLIYRIRLLTTFNRDDAQKAQDKFRNLYPSKSSFLNHNGTQFLVTAGSFGSKPEAEIFLQELRRNFPASFILPPEKQK